jgi:hypothetical protein
VTIFLVALAVPALTALVSAVLYDLLARWSSAIASVLLLPLIGVAVCVAYYSSHFLLKRLISRM